MQNPYSGCCTITNHKVKLQVGVIWGLFFQENSQKFTQIEVEIHQNGDLPRTAMSQKQDAVTKAEASVSKLEKDQETLSNQRTALAELYNKDAIWKQDGTMNVTCSLPDNIRNLFLGKPTRTMVSEKYAELEDELKV